MKRSARSVNRNVVMNIAVQGPYFPLFSKAFKEFPNTVSKIKSMVDHVETPLAKSFKGKPDELLTAAKRIGGADQTAESESVDLALLFRPLPRIPVMLLFWDQDEDEDFEAKVSLLFDETILEHLDIESIVFLSERLKQLFCENYP